MKTLMLLAVILAGVWLWRSRSSVDQRSGLKQSRAAAPPLTMVCCNCCGVHIPNNEMVVGRQGNYCSQVHLQQSEP